MSLMQATTAARVAYSAVALTIIGYPLLDKIEAIRTMPVPKPRGGGVTAELEAAAAAGAAAAAAALKGAGHQLASSAPSLYYTCSMDNCGQVPAELLNTSRMQAWSSMI